jgi:hypothetical protein
MPKFSLISVVLSFLVASVLPATSEVVYNHVGAERTPLDNLVHEHFDKLRPVVDVSGGDRSYVEPIPLGPRSGSGKAPMQDPCVEGTILIIYIIERDGSVALPFVAKSTDPALSIPAIARIDNLQFVPAKLDGQAIASAAVSRYRFTCPSRAGER